ncbi:MULTISPECIES: hypothetical protein [unclassified Mesorhizobium]|uniref:hypothetical protein n=1 Tax=unclassified Mesorhizobium TaxID=325217 RepID=UPI001925C068|nr:MULTISPECIES: hypothetical protein [unclassified Mesorhizobium]
MLNAGYGYRSLPVVGEMAMLVAVAVALASHIWAETRCRAGCRIIGSRYRSMR